MRNAGTAISGSRAGIEQRLQTAFYEVQVGGADSGFLGEWLLKLAGLDLELGLDPHVEINVADNGSGGGVRVGQ